MQTTKTLFCLFLILIAYGAIDWLANRPQDAGANVPSGKLMSLSFAPYHEGFSPVEQKFPLPGHIDEDLRLLADKTHNIRTYSVLGGMEPTPDFARKYGVDMIQGGWLGNGHDGNNKEIAALIKSANANPDVVKRVIVGNEVLLRKDMDVDLLIGYIRQVKQAVKQPVSYADVWSSYMKYPQLFKEVDFITIHILPYWEDEPISIEHVDEHIEKIVKQIQNKALSMGQSKPILIGETGWPAAGRQRGSAVPSIVNEAKFIRGLIQVANRNGLDYNIVEAFNQSWKSHDEGVVGANWGLLSSDREPVFPLTGPVLENLHWQLHFAASILVWLLIVTAFFKKLHTVSFSCLLIFLILNLLMSISLVSMADFLWRTSYSAWQRAYTMVLVVANLSLIGLLAQRFYNVLTDSSCLQPLATRLAKLYFFFILLAIYKSYSLAFNGRYLSFPVEQFTTPVIGVCGLIICLWMQQHRLKGPILAFNDLIGDNLNTKHYRSIALLMSLGILGVVIGETKEFMTAYDFIQMHPGFFQGLPFALGYTLHNQQLLGWLLSISILSIPFWPKNTQLAKH